MLKLKKFKNSNIDTFPSGASEHTLDILRDREGEADGKLQNTRLCSDSQRNKADTHLSKRKQARDKRVSKMVSSVAAC